MTQEEKELLLKDLCARLSCDVKIQGIIYEDILDNYGEETGEVEEKIVTFNLYIIGKNSIMCEGSWISLELCKPYLRPMSSITEEEVKEFYEVEDMDHPVGYIKPQPDWHFTINGIDWLNKHHFDYRGLIPIGLALEAPEGMYEIK